MEKPHDEIRNQTTMPNGHLTQPLDFPCDELQVHAPPQGSEPGQTREMSLSLQLFVGAMAILTFLFGLSLVSLMLVGVRWLWMTAEC